MSLVVLVVVAGVGMLTFHFDSLAFARLLNFSFCCCCRELFFLLRSRADEFGCSHFSSEKCFVKSVPWDPLSSISLLIGNRRTNSVRELYMAAQQYGLGLFCWDGSHTQNLRKKDPPGSASSQFVFELAGLKCLSTPLAIKSSFKYKHVPFYFK
jgi:hypothetical protein